MTTCILSALVIGKNRKLIQKTIDNLLEQVHPPTQIVVATSDDGKPPPMTWIDKNEKKCKESGVPFFYYKVITGEFIYKNVVDECFKTIVSRAIPAANKVTKKRHKVKVSHFIPMLAGNTLGSDRFFENFSLLVKRGKNALVYYSNYKNNGTMYHAYPENLAKTADVIIFRYGYSFYKELMKKDTYVQKCQHIYDERKKQRREDLKTQSREEVKKKYDNKAFIKMRSSFVEMGCADDDELLG